MSKLRILMIGDLVGQPGVKMFCKHIASLREKYNADAVVVNGENAANNGRGITPGIAKTLKEHGADVITSGNHIWGKKEIGPFIQQNDYLLRPANYPGMCPGSGHTTFEVKGATVAVINLQGRVFMREQVDSPFRAADSLLTLLRSKTKIILVDFHAETTAETAGMAFYLEGKVSAVVGTHTHIQTADQRVLPGGTAYMTDLGMSGALNSMIGMKKDLLLRHMITQMPVKFEVDEEPPYVMSGCCITVDTLTGKAEAIEPVRIIDEEQVV